MTCRSLPVLALLLLAMAPAARAFTLDLQPRSLTIEVGLIDAEVTILDVLEGSPAGADVLAGVVASDDVTILLQIALDPASVAIRPALVTVRRNDGTFDLVTPTGGGTLAGAGTPIVAMALAPAPPLGSGMSVAFEDFQLDPGALSDPFFLSYSGLMPGQLFSVGLGVVLPPGSQFGRLDGGSLAIVPAPPLAPLVAGVLAAVLRRPGGLGRRRGRPGRSG